jgi:hypothetical protein
MGRTPEYGRLKGVMVRRLYHQEPIITSALARILRINIERYKGMSRGEENKSRMSSGACCSTATVHAPRLTQTKSNNTTKDSQHPSKKTAHKVIRMRYRKLRKVRNEIRLLTIINNDTSPLTCTLEHVSLSTSPSYKALSYSWGSQNATKPVIINGSTIAVTTNLETALRQFRSEGHGWLWIDALCINQGDLAERSEQVLRMGTIFSAASEVIAWLGPQKWDSDLAMRFMREFGKVAAEELKTEPFLNWSKPISRGECRADEEKSWVALDGLFNRPYWTRLWVVQELMLARRVVLRCGDAEAAFDDLCAAVRIADRRAFHPAFTDGAQRETHRRHIFCLFCLVFNKASGGTDGFQPVDLLIALSYTKYHVATDLRDKVYGILALTTNGAEMVGRPSYDEGTEDLYIRLTRSLLSTRERSDFIAFKPTERNFGLKLPTWALDLSAPCFPSDPLRESCFHVPLLWPESDSSMNESEAAEVPLAGDRHVLKIEGVLVDVVDGFGVAQYDVGGSVIVQPDNSYNGYDSDLDMRYAIINSIFQRWNPIQDLVEGEGTAQLIRLGWKWLWQPSGRTTIVPWQQALLQFQDQNRDLLIAGRRLEDWALDAPENLPLKVWQKLWKQKLREEDLTDGTAKNLLVNYMFPEFQAWNSWSRKIVVTRRGYVGSVHPQAQKGDLICCLKNCWNPVVLRAVDDGFFQLIGNAEMHGFDKGMKGFIELQKNIDEGRAETFQLI